MELGRVVRELMSAEELDAALTTTANAIDQETRGQQLILVGIRTRGVPLADRLAAKLRAVGREVKTGILDITLYRDDLSEIGPVPMVGATDIPVNISGLPVVLVDDVLFTGRTIRAALDCINDFGRPRRIQLAVLVDRGGRELPIQADYKTLTVGIEDNEVVAVKLREIDGKDCVELLQRDMEEAQES